MRTEDGHIIQKCLDGDAAAFGLLVDKYKGSVYALAYAKLGDFHDAQDLTQEVFLKAYRKLRTLKRWDRFLSWLYAITSNSCKDFLRSKASRPDDEYVSDQEKEHLANISIDSHREDKLHQTLRETLSELPEVHRQVLSLHYLGGLSCKEIAQFLGISPHAIAMRLSRARAKLRKEMLTTMHASFDRQKLHSAFTLNIVEMIRRTQIQPNPQVPVIPIGIAAVGLLTLSMLCLITPFNQLPAIGKLIGAPIPSESKVMDVGEIPVDVVMLSKSSVVSSGDGKKDLTRNPRQTNGVYAANPDAEVETSGRNEPVARLGNGAASRLVYSPDGKLIAVMGQIGIWLYDAETLQEVGMISGGATTMAFSPDGNLLASGFWTDPTAQLWDVKTQERVGDLPSSEEWGVTALAFIPGGRTLAVGYSDGAIGLWNIDTKQQTGRLDTPVRFVWTMTVSSDGQFLASAGFEHASISVWNLQTSALVSSFMGHDTGQEIDTISSIAFSPDGSTLASGISFDDTIRLWKVETGTQIASLTKNDSAGEHPDVSSLVYSPDGTLLASAGDDAKIRLWDAQTLKQIGALETDGGSVSSIAFRPDGETLASLNGGDAETGWRKGGDMALRLWDLETREQIAAIRQHNAKVESAALSPDGTLLAIGRQDGAVALWNLYTEKLSTTLTGHIATVKSVAFSSDGTLLASGEREHARLWDVSKGRQIATFEHTAIVESVVFSPDGKTLACVDDNCIRLWDTQRKREIAVLGQEPPRTFSSSWDRMYAKWRNRVPFTDMPVPYWSTLRSVAFSPDGTMLASGGTDNTIRVWDVAKQREIFAQELDAMSNICVVAFSPDGEILASAGTNGKIHLWSPKKRELVGSFNIENWCQALAFSPEGNLLAAGDGSKIRVWDLATSTEITTLDGFQVVINSVDFSRDGRKLVASWSDGVIRIWNTSGFETH